MRHIEIVQKSALGVRFRALSLCSNGHRSSGWSIWHSGAADNFACKIITSVQLEQKKEIWPEDTHIIPLSSICGTTFQLGRISNHIMCYPSSRGLGVECCEVIIRAPNSLWLSTPQGHTFNTFSIFGFSSYYLSSGVSLHSHYFRYSVYLLSDFGELLSLFNWSKSILRGLGAYFWNWWITAIMGYTFPVKVYNIYFLAAVSTIGGMLFGVKILATPFVFHHTNSW